MKKALKHPTIPKISVATGNSHGFTGLNYVYSPSGSEVHYWCAKDGSKIDCQFHHRTLPSGANQSTKDYSCQTSNSPGAQVPDEFTLGDIDFRVGCGRGIFIGADRKGEQLHQVTHQDIENGTHGVTGLNYVYSPAGEEVQYWCSLK